MIISPNGEEEEAKDTTDKTDYRNKGGRTGNWERLSIKRMGEHSANRIQAGDIQVGILISALGAAGNNNRLNGAIPQIERPAGALHRENPSRRSMPILR